MKRLFIICLFFIACSGFAQLPVFAKSLLHVWVVDSGTFPDNVIKMKAYDAATDSSRFYQSYEFLEKGEIEFRMHYTRGLLMCGNGTPYLKKGSWFFKNQYVRIKLSGGYFAAGTYRYDLLYKVEWASDDKLVLKKVNTYVNQRCESCIK